MGVLFDPWLTRYTLGVVVLPADPLHHWDSLSAHWWVCLRWVPLPSQLHAWDHAFPSWPFFCPTLCGRIQKQDGFMAHHFYYGYLLPPCCVSKTKAVRFRLQTPAKPSRAACGSLSQQHLTPCLNVGGASSPAAYRYIAPQPCSWTYGFQVWSPALEQSCCICTCWAGNRGGAGACC